MTDIIDIGIRADSSDIKQARGELDKFGKTATNTGDDIDGLNKSTDRARGEFGRLVKQEEKATRATDALSKSTKHLATNFLPIATLTTAATVAFTYSISKTIEFNKSISELSAITGATGKNLEFMRQKSIEFGSATTQSASEVATAFKLVASAKPDLLENAVALSEVTREVITLSEAAGVGLADAADTVGGALNQFSAESDQASRFVNVLAAGAKFGSSAINETAQALKNSGTVAAGAKLSFEQTNAAIQAMAEVSLKGAEAGTGLRSVLLKLSTQANDDFNPKIVGMTKALKNLEEAELSDIEKKKLFGAESIIAANALIKSAETAKNGKTKFENLTIALTGTSTAMEQARTNTNNLDGDMKNLGSATEALGLSIGSKLTPTIRTMTQSFTDGINEMRIFFDVMTNAKTIDAVTIKLADVGDEIDALTKQIEDRKKNGDGFFESIFGTAVVDVEVEANRKLKELKDQYKALSEERDLLINPMADKPATQQDQSVADKPQQPRQLASAIADPEAISNITSAAIAETENALTIAEELVVARQAKAVEDELAHATDIIDIHSYKFEQMRIIADAAGGTDADRLMAQEEADLLAIEAERERFLEATAIQYTDEEERLKALEDLNVYFDKLRLERQKRTEEERVAQMSKAAKFAESIQKGEYATTLAMSSNLLGAMSKHNRVAFEAKKAATIGKVVLNGIDEVSEAASLPFPMNIPATIFAVADVASRLAAANSASFGGGGGASAPSAPSAPSVQAPMQTPAPVPVSQQVAGQDNTNSPTPVHVFINGTTTIDSLVNEVVPASLKDLIANKDYVLIDGNSTNSQVIQAAA